MESLFLENGNFYVPKTKGISILSIEGSNCFLAFVNLFGACRFIEAGGLIAPTSPETDRNEEAKMNEAPVVPASRPRDAGGRFGPAQQLEDLWRHGQRPNIEEFLHRQENLNAEQIIAILGVDQWRRWHGGERVPAEF